VANVKIIGIDPSSSCTGIALVEDGNLIDINAWYKDKNKTASENLVLYYDWLYTWISFNEPDVAVIEFLSVVRNAEATRKISHYQALSALVCKQKNLLIIESRVTSARKVTLGNGGLSKEKAFQIIKKRFSEFDFGRIDKGGGDKSDAVILALGGVALAER
jgi:Holliday junction resolvasome RuvABC endonuclease subunit